MSLLGTFESWPLSNVAPCSGGPRLQPTPPRQPLRPLRPRCDGGGRFRHRRQRSVLIPLFPLLLLRLVALGLRAVFLGHVRVHGAVQERIRDRPIGLLVWKGLALKPSALEAGVHTYHIHEYINNAYHDSPPSHHLPRTASTRAPPSTPRDSVSWDTTCPPPSFPELPAHPPAKDCPNGSNTRN